MTRLTNIAAVLLGSAGAAICLYAFMIPEVLR